MTVVVGNHGHGACAPANGTAKGNAGNGLNTFAATQQKKKWDHQT